MNPKSNQSVACYREALHFEASGDLQSAKRCYKKAIKLNPHFAEALTNLGTLQLAEEQHDEAIRLFQSAARQLPSHPLVLNNLGNALQLKGRNREAVKVLVKAIEYGPQSFSAHNNLGNALVGLNQFEEAIKAYQKALELCPDDINVTQNLSQIYQRTGDDLQAIDLLKKFRSRQPENLAARLEQGNAERSARLFMEAEQTFSEILKCDPDNLSALEALAGVKSDLGETRAASTLFRRMLELDSFHGAAWAGLCDIGGLDENANELQQLERILEGHALNQEDQGVLRLKISKVYEKLGEFDKAISAIKTGNRQLAASRPHSIGKTVRAIEQIIRGFSKERLQELSGHGVDSRRPIFILGMPRSGSSLLEQVLASHPQIDGAGELHTLKNLADAMTGFSPAPDWRKSLQDISGEALKQLGRSYLNRTDRFSSGARFLTDKMPHNFLYVGLIHLALPNATIIHIRRNPMDNCLSLYKNHFKGDVHNYAYDQKALGSYFQQYERLMHHWSQVLESPWLEVRYEELVTDLEGQIRSLLKTLGLPWSDSCLDFYKTKRGVGTASNAQVRKPVYGSSVGAWMRYEKELRPLKNALGQSPPRPA